MSISAAKPLLKQKMFMKKPIRMYLIHLLFANFSLSFANFKEANCTKRRLFNNYRKKRNNKKGKKSLIQKKKKSNIHITM